MKPKYELTVYRDDEFVSKDELEDPFHRTTVTICMSHWELLKAMFRRQYKTEVVVRLNAPMEVINAVMNVEPAPIPTKTFKEWAYRGEGDCGASR